MKKILLLTALSFMILFSFAQHVPQGMKYQAIARNLTGEIIANQPVSLKINLVTEQGSASTVYYSEIHNVTTNQLGLFTLTIGEGSVQKGTFSSIPWSTEDIWMQVAIKDNGKADFVTISNSKLLAVPYAFHAETASKLVDNSSSQTKTGLKTEGVPSANWSLKGNSSSDPATDKLGTTDFADLVLVTNDSERLRILANGDVNLKNTLTVGNNLNAGQSVKLNTVGGTTDIKGAANLQSTLDVTDSTHLKSALTTDGIETITNNTASTNTENGALVVKGGVGIGGNLNVAGATSFGSVSVSSSVAAKSLNLTDDNEGYIATITNTNTAEGDGVKIKLGRVHPLWNGTAYESIEADDFNPVYKAFEPQITTVGTWLKNKNVTITPADVLSLLKSTGTFLAGALCQLTNALSPLLNEKIGLPMDISTPLNKGIGLPMDISTPLNNGMGLPVNISGPINSGMGLPMDISGPINSGLGLPATLGPYSIPAVEMPAVELPALSVNLGSVLGSFDIIGATTLIPKTTLLAAFTLIPKTTIVPALPAFSIPAIPAFSIPKIPAFSIPAIPAFSIPAIPQIDCGGLPQIGAPNIRTDDVTNSLSNKNEYIKFVDKDDRTVGVIRAQSIGDFRNEYLSNEYLFHLVAKVGGIDIAKGLLNLGSELNTLAHAYNKLGVEYVSGNGDYAEWMERTDFDESITPGDIVGVKGGKITKDLNGAEQIMAVSTQPIVSANMPNNEKVRSGNTIAFVGQIPVKIIGPVTTGDFIVAKGKIPGYGVAVKPSQMTTEDYRLIVGRAWETIDVDGPKLVNTLVGVQNNDFLKIIEKYQQKVSDVEERLAAIEKKLNMPQETKKTRTSKK
jgi:hypothetical protein